MPDLVSFSSQYALVNGAEVRTWSEDAAHMDFNLYEALVDVVGEPVIGLVEGRNYEFTPSKQVLSNQCAIPDDRHRSEPSALLVKK